MSSSHRRISIFSPAKVNFFFKVIRKRSDGYHEIASLYQAVSLGDHLYLRVNASKDSFRCEGLDLPFDNSNLVFKALLIFRKMTNLLFFVDIVLEKRIPIMAGLGGGSSNGASTLWALNELFGRPLSHDQLQEAGSSLGSDLAFFFSSGSALCYSRGERCEDIDFIKTHFFIAKPSFGMSTPDVYKHLQLEKLEDNHAQTALNSYASGSFDFFNDLESSAFALNPSLADLKRQLLNSGFEKVVMTGSGSAFICFGRPRFFLDNISYFPVENIQRKSDSWYPTIF